MIQLRENYRTEGFLKVIFRGRLKVVVRFTEFEKVFGLIGSCGWNKISPRFGSRRQHSDYSQARLKRVSSFIAQS